MSETKAFSGVEIKSVDEGRVLAHFATYNEIDHHDDLTRKGAFEDGAEVVVSAYNHQSWGGSLPVGKGRIRDGGTGAVADIQFFMNTQAGRDTFETVKQLGSLQQWSYGFDVVEKSREDVETPEGEQKSVRVLKKVRVHEVSPVMLGAGKSTSTLAVKHMNLEDPDFLDMLIERLEEKASGKPKPKPKKPGNNDSSSDSDEESGQDNEDDSGDENDDSPAARRRRRMQQQRRGNKKPGSNSSNSSGKMRMSDQTEDVITDLKELADRAEEIVTLRKSQGKSGISDSLNQQFHELLKQADRIFDLYTEIEDEDDEVALKANGEEQQAEFRSMYAQFTRDNLSEEL